MKIVIALEVSEVLELCSDAEIKREIDTMIKDYHAYSMIKSHTVGVIR